MQVYFLLFYILCKIAYGSFPFSSSETESWNTQKLLQETPTLYNSIKTVQLTQSLLFILVLLWKGGCHFPKNDCQLP